MLAEGPGLVGVEEAGHLCPGALPRVAWKPVP